jgi:hypothetical protein
LLIADEVYGDLAYAGPEKPQFFSLPERATIEVDGRWYQSHREGSFASRWTDLAPGKEYAGWLTIRPDEQWGHLRDKPGAAGDPGEATRELVPFRLTPGKHTVRVAYPFGKDVRAVSNPITVWRQASYNPVFDDNYIYKLVNVRSRQALDVSGNYTGENGAVVQWYDNGSTNQQFRIIQVATSQWKIIGVPSGKALTDRNGSSANVLTNSYNGAATDNWAIDDHNGHFIIRNKATNAYLRAPNGSAGAAVSVTTGYSGNADTDWDLTAVNSL